MSKSLSCAVRIIDEARTDLPEPGRPVHQRYPGSWISSVKKEVKSGSSSVHSQEPDGKWTHGHCVCYSWNNLGVGGEIEKRKAELTKRRRIEMN